MLLVTDANVVFSALVKNGVPLKVFKLNTQLRLYEFVAPQLMLSEIKKNLHRLLALTGLTEEQLWKAVSAVTGEIMIVPFSQFADKLQEATELNVKDAPYLALALKLRCPIFSGDKGLKKQSRVEVLSPRELLDRLLEL